MKVVIYCQHVLGVGHFFRTVEIAKAMNAFDVILVTGGGQLDVILPSFIKHVELPGLMMDENFSGLHSVDPKRTVDEVKSDREKLLMDLIQSEKPDCLLVELYPFGRRSFRFELNPVLDYIKTHPSLKCRVICSLRDILVEKKEVAKYETRVVKALNQWFDTVLVHSDPDLVELSSTFSRMDKIEIPIKYTGFITPLPDQAKVNQIRNHPGNNKNKRVIIASAGGGNVGAKLLEAIARVCKLKFNDGNTILKVFTGPYMEADKQAIIHSFANECIIVKSFTDDFVSHLAAADLSVSMGGYNTCMNIVAAKVPALIWPFGQNREQKMRALKLKAYADIDILSDDDLKIEPLAGMIQSKLETGKQIKLKSLDMDGARKTFNCIQGVQKK